MPQHRAFGKRAGFRLLDLLVAMLLAGLLSGVAAASVARVRAAQDRTRSANNLKQIMLAAHDCANVYQGKLPPGRANFFPSMMLAPQTGYGPCLFHLLPFIEQDNLYKASLVTAGSTPIFASWKGAGTAIKVYLGPGDPTADLPSDHTSYLASGLALPRTGARLPASFPDGLSNTIVFAEGYGRAIGSHSEVVERRWWDDAIWTPSLTGVPYQVTPTAETASARLPQSLSPSGLQVAMGDGGTRLVKLGCSSKTFYEACTPSGGEIPGDDW